MKRPVLALLAAAPLALGACRTQPDYDTPLPPGAPALIPLAKGEPKPDLAADWTVREELLPALDRSIEWMHAPSSRQFFPIEDISHAHALKSLERFREILVESSSHAEVRRAIEQDFTIYKSAGWNAKGGGVLFTAYCTPILRGAAEPGTEYSWPLYALPPDLVKGEHGAILGRRTTGGGIEPYPTRAAIEAGALLEGQGLELVWLRNPMDAFIAHVNGSAIVRLADGGSLRLGYAGKNGREYRSLGRQLVEAGVMRPSEVSLSSLREWARTTPIDEVMAQLHKNDSYVFFTPIEGNPRGSLGVEVTAGRTLATDKSLFPRGAVTFVQARVPTADGKDQQTFDRFMLDQDTGGAIRTAGRADIYLGVGDLAEARAGYTRSEGQLYYLFLSDNALVRYGLQP